MPNQKTPPAADGIAETPDRSNFQRLAEILEEEHNSLDPSGPKAIRAPAPGSDFTDHDSRLAEIIKTIHASDQGRSALCLSGGGIRSACFGLGVLQALARKGLLGQFDYLSTVSGGGYIGGWLSAWIRNHEKGSKGVMAALAKGPSDPTDPEWKPVRHLRSFSNYLTPKLGMLSVDSWTLAATVLRNIFLNWLVLISFFILLLVLPRVLVAGAYGVPEAILNVLLAIAFIGIATPVAYAVLDLPDSGNAGWIEKRYWRWRMLPLALAVLALCAWWAGKTNTDSDVGPWIGSRASILFFAKFTMAATVAGYAAAWVFAFVKAKRIAITGARSATERFKLRPTRFLRGLLASTVSAGFGGCILWCLARYTPVPVEHVLAYVCLAPPLLLGIFLFSNFLMTGVSSHFSSDQDRDGGAVPEAGCCWSSLAGSPGSPWRSTRRTFTQASWSVFS